MATDGISKVRAADAIAEAQPRALPLVARFFSRGSAESAGRLADSSPEKAVPATGGQAAELLIGQEAHAIEVEGHSESYAKIRYDKDARAVLIQIVDAASGEVVQEIPPQAWARMRGAVGNDRDNDQQLAGSSKQ